LGRVGEEQIGQIERRRRAPSENARAALGGDVGKAFGDIWPTGEEDRLDPGADRSLAMPASSPQSSTAVQCAVGTAARVSSINARHQLGPA